MAGQLRAGDALRKCERMLRCIADGRCGGISDLAADCEFALHGGCGQRVGEAVACCEHVSVGSAEKGCGKLTLCGVEHDQDIVVLAGILDLIQADESSFGTSPSRQSTFLFAHFTLTPALLHWQGEFTIHHSQRRFTALVRFFVGVCDPQLEIHCIGMREVLEKGKELDDVVLLDDLQTDAVGGPLLVDGTTIRRRDMEKEFARLGRVSTYRIMAQNMNVPVEFHMKASNSQLEGVKIVERIEGKSSDRGGTCKSFE